MTWAHWWSNTCVCPSHSLLVWLLLCAHELWMNEWPIQHGYTNNTLYDVIPLHPHIRTTTPHARVVMRWRTCTSHDLHTDWSTEAMTRSIITAHAPHTTHTHTVTTCATTNRASHTQVSQGTVLLPLQQHLHLLLVLSLFFQFLLCTHQLLSTAIIISLGLALLCLH